MPLLLVSFLASLLAVTADDSSLLDQLIVSGDVANSFLTSGTSLKSRRQHCTRRVPRRRHSGITVAYGLFKFLTNPGCLVVAKEEEEEEEKKEKNNEEEENEEEEKKEEKQEKKRRTAERRRKS
jgi:hypothetical protein